MAPNPEFLQCLPNVGCSPVIELSKAVAAATQHLKNHGEASTKFWEGYKEEIEDIALQFKECLKEAQEHNLKLNDGRHRMKTIEDKAKRMSKWITSVVICCGLIIIFIGTVHPTIWDAIAKWVGIQ